MSTAQTTLLLLIPAAYLVGSIPFGLLVGWSRGIDVRKAGSGNIGATNVGRLLGGKFFALVFVLDLLKGLGPMLAGGAAVGNALDACRLDAPATGAAAEVAHVSAGDSTTLYLLWLGVAFAAIAGHMFSLFLKFKGGKGVATSAGVVLGLFPYYTLPAVVALAVWAALFYRTRIVSLASIVAAVLFPAAYLAFALPLGWQPFGAQLPLLAFAVLMGVMIVYRHRSNIARLRAGTESRFGRSGGKPAAGQGGGGSPGDARPGDALPGDARPGDALPSANGDHAGGAAHGGRG
jgi:glycerol-3-phosphate acyltransferase PlsY